MTTGSEPRLPCSRLGRGGWARLDPFGTSLISRTDQLVDATLFYVTHDAEITASLPRAQEKARNIARTNANMYAQPIPLEEILLTTAELQLLLRAELPGLHVPGHIKTRSKNAKQHVATVLGYGQQSSFTRTRPAFPAQNLTVGVQNADNLQIWGEDPAEIPDDRRFVLLRLDNSDCIENVRVVEWQNIKHWDRTGTLTTKLQASRRSGRQGSALVSDLDTKKFTETLSPSATAWSRLAKMSAADLPRPVSTLPIREMYERLVELVGCELDDSNSDRIRGESLQQLVCSQLGIGEYSNPSNWPDNPLQVLEIKLQTARTIDLGAVLPSSKDPVVGLGTNIRFCDGRYLVVYGEPASGNRIRITEVVLTTGLNFFDEFQQFEGNVVNSKAQLRIPKEFFESDS